MRDGGLALVDLENACIGPVGLDLGRFIRSNILLGAVRRAESHDVATIPWDGADAFEDFAASCEESYHRALADAALTCDFPALRKISRSTALMSLCQASGYLLRAAKSAPEVTAPVAELILRLTDELIGDS